MLPARSVLRRVTGVAAMVAALVGFAGDTSAAGEPPVRGSGVVKEETRPVANFTGVTLAGVGQVKIEVTGKEGLRIKAEDNILPLLTAEVQDGTLTLGSVPNANFSSTKPIEYFIEVKDLKAVNVAGTGNVTANGLKAGRLKAIVHGTGNVALTGTADDLETVIQGTGNVNADGLPAKRVTAQVNGTGHAVVNATEQLDATVNGTGSVEYLGDPPQVHKSIGGVGRVRKR